ncbi:uncharacterized protein METZ01_LOCUS167331, partial [marine metagenome]
MTYAQDQVVMRKYFRMKLQVVVDRIIEFVAVLFGPSCKVNFPNIKKTTSWSVEG